MGSLDKDRFQKELAVRYCLARGALPCLEVLVSSASDLSARPEVLTDIDVLGIEVLPDGGLRKIIFDCKTGAKMSAINRAFWAGGVVAYVNADYAFVILRSKSVQNHRLSALRMGVDLHDEGSFRALGQSIEIDFHKEKHYQSSIDRWNALLDVYQKLSWAGQVYDITHNAAPLSSNPAATFRKMLAELRDVRGEFDPKKNTHLAIFFDMLASFFILWTVITRDISRLSDPNMVRGDFEALLRFYLWGGREAYEIRRMLREKLGKDNRESVDFDLPAWGRLVDLSAFFSQAPGSVYGCAHLCREIALRLVSKSDSSLDCELEAKMTENSRAQQFISLAIAYLAEAGFLPKDMVPAAEAEIYGT